MLRDDLPIAYLSDQDILDYEMKYKDDKFIVRLLEEFKKMRGNRGRFNGPMTGDE